MLSGLKLSKALDIGCGQGMLGLLGVRDVLGMDVRSGTALTIYGSAEHVPFRDGAFDLVYAGEILEHLDRPVKALRDWVRVLDSRGTLILSTPNGRLVSAVGGNPEHRATYAPETIAGILEELGLKVVSSKGIFTGLISGRRLFRMIPFGWAKTFIIRFPVPVSLSYDVYIMARKRNNFRLAT